MSESKWLTPNKASENLRPVKLFEKMMAKRTSSLKTNRLFLSPNKDWKATTVVYKNYPLGLNQISKWTRLGAENVGIDTKKARITNHSRHLFDKMDTTTTLSSQPSNVDLIPTLTTLQIAQLISYRLHISHSFLRSPTVW